MILFQCKIVDFLDAFVLTQSFTKYIMHIFNHTLCPILYNRDSVLKHSVLELLAFYYEKTIPWFKTVTANLTELYFP